MSETYSEKKKSTAALLCFFFGVLGIHRFYTGKVGTGFLYLLTGGLVGIGVIVDFVKIVCGSFTDKDGYQLA